jgi:DNA polymerase elongation subunit (family B)
MKIVHAFVGDRSENNQLILLHPDGVRTSVPASYDYFVGSDRVKCRTWKQRKQLLDAETRPHLDGDLNPVRRYLADHPEIEIVPPRRALADIETDPRPGFERKHEMRILCWTIVAEDTGEMWTGVLNSEDDESESILLLEMWERLKPFTCITAYNGGDNWSDRMGFDFPVIRARSLRYWPELKWRWDRFLWQDHYKCYKRLKFEESGENKTSFSLDAVCQRELGEGKEDYDSRECYNDWRAGGERRSRMVRYNQKDVVLMRRLEQKTGMLALGHQVCASCGVLPDTTGLQPTTFVDQFLLRMGGHRPTKVWKPDYRKQKYEGGYVREPTGKGIVKDVFFLDANSLYPSIIQTLNASPDTKGELGSVSPMTGITFATDRVGLLPQACTILKERKAEFKTAYKKLPEGASEFITAKMLHDGYKAIVNSFYGVVGSEKSPWYDKDIARSITLTGQFFLKSIETEAEIAGLTPIVGDTDSLGVTDCTEKQVHGFIDHCNQTVFPRIVQNHRGIPGNMKIAFDKHFDRFLNGVKDDGTPAKKKYLGRFAGTGELSITGFEYKRGDASPLARKLQESVARKIMIDECEDPEDFPLLLIAARDKILYDELPLEEIVLSESLGKELEDYATVSPAVSAARILRERGSDVSRGTKIRYVVTNGSISPIRVIPAEDYVGQCDRWYLWENLVYPPTERLLAAAFPSHDWKQYANVRPAKVRENAERKYQAKLEAKGQIRIPET